MAAAPVVPAETFIVGATKLPRLVKASELVLRFESNLPDARFECRSSSSGSFQVCADGRSFKFAPLRQGQSYFLAVRAVGAQGQVDHTPAEVSFSVDLAAGKDPNATPIAPDSQHKREKISVEKLPVATTNTDGDSASREVLLGGVHSVIVPYDMYLRSLSSDRNLVEGVVSYRLVSAGDPPVTTDEPCNRSWERLRQREDHFTFCESFPSASEINAANRPMPVNHVVVERGTASEPGEALLMATFTDQEHRFEQRFTIPELCSDARSRGRSTGLSLTFDAAAAPSEQTFDWCQQQDAKGRWWWIGLYRSVWPKSRGNERVVMVYTLLVGGAVIAPAQFAERAHAFLPTVLMPNTALRF